MHSISDIMHSSQYNPPYFDYWAFLASIVIKIIIIILSYAMHMQQTAVVYTLLHY